MSVRLEGCGYASLVVGRQLFIWKYRDDGEKSVSVPLVPFQLYIFVKNLMFTREDGT